MMLTRTLQSWSVLTMCFASADKVNEVTMLLRWPSRNWAGTACSGCADAVTSVLIAAVKTSPNLSAQMISLLSMLKIAAVIFLGQRLQHPAPVRLLIHITSWVEMGRKATHAV